MRLIDVDAFKADYRMADECKDCKTPVRACEYDRVYTKMDFCSWLDDAPTINLEQKTVEWIPCSERLPEEDTEVLISYRYKEGEGDTSNTYIDITTYGQMYFGGNKVGDYKHWRAPFEYFESNYEVIAWMPLPEPYREGGQDENR